VKRKQSKIGAPRAPRRIPRDAREDILEATVALMNAPEPVRIVDDHWDPERELHFRPANFLSEPNPSHFLCKKLVITYGGLVRRERAREDVAPASIRTKLEKMRSGMLKFAGEMERMSQPELRVILEAAPKSEEAFVRDIIPLKWPGSDSRSAFTQLLREKADRLEQLLKPIRERAAGTVWSKNAGGRGHNILHWLNIGTARWQLIHVTWRVFEDLNCTLPPDRKVEDLVRFLSYIHELATGQPDEDFSGSLSRYVTVRREFDELSRDLRDETARMRLETFYQLEDHFSRKTARAKRISSVDQKLGTQLARYTSLRRQLLTGPLPLPRKCKPKKNSKGL
jgi:hypothetical protein